MGIDYHWHICVRNEVTGKWKEILLYNKSGDSFVPHHIDFGRCHTMYNILHREVEACGSVSIKGLEDGELKSMLLELFDAPEYTGCYGLEEINLADLIIYTLKHPKIEDEDSEDGEIDNPLIKLVDAVHHYLMFCNSIWSDVPDSRVKIIFFCDN